MITRAVGTEPTVEVETLTLAAAPGDLYLICSDGLTDIVRDEQIAELIRDADADPDAAAEALVAAANRAGGIDNITVVLFEIIEGDPTPPPEPPPSSSRTRTRWSRRPRRWSPPPARARAVPVRRHGAGAGGRWLALLAIVAHRRRRRARRLLEPRPVSARNKELLNLGFAALVASAAFASVSIVSTGLVTARWLGYVGVIFGLYLVAHVVARFTVPYADPTLLPLVGLLTAIGLTVIYRLGPDDARRQAVWVAVGIGVLVGDADLAALRLPRARALQVPLRDLGRRPAAAAVGAGARPPGQRRQALDQGRADAVPAGRAGEDLPDHLPRRLPARQARVARAGDGSRTSARCS